jgi:predicted alpha/beta-fold hydrolase
VNARNDPMLAPECFPEDEAAPHRWLHLEAPASGGHVGFLDFRQGLEPWTERRIVDFLDTVRED